jgi:hypothetical protein
MLLGPRAMDAATREWWEIRRGKSCDGEQLGHGMGGGDDNDRSGGNNNGD